MSVLCQYGTDFVILGMFLPVQYCLSLWGVFQLFQYSASADMILVVTVIWFWFIFCKYDYDFAIITIW